MGFTSIDKKIKVEADKLSLCGEKHNINDGFNNNNNNNNNYSKYNSRERV